MASTEDIVAMYLGPPCVDNAWQSDTPPSASTDSGRRTFDFDRPRSEHVPGWVKRENVVGCQATPTNSMRPTSAGSSIANSRPYSDAYSSSFPEEESLAEGDEPSEGFENLREEIVARGHPVTLYREEVYLTQEACRGYLEKMGGRVKTWRRRWFVFDRDQAQLIYFIDATETRRKGLIDFTNMQDVYVNTNPPRRFRSPNRRLTFCLDTASRTFYFVASSSEVMRIWIDVLLTAVKACGGRFRV